jgi:hypothetical protein
MLHRSVVEQVRERTRLRARDGDVVVAANRSDQAHQREFGAAGGARVVYEEDLHGAYPPSGTEMASKYSRLGAFALVTHG